MSLWFLLCDHAKEHLANPPKDDLDLFQEHMFGIFDQTHCEQNSEVTGDKYGFIKDLDKVWASSLCKSSAEAGAAFDSTNTLLLESDELSVHKCHKNSLVIDRYERDDVWPAPDKPYRD